MPTHFRKCIYIALQWLVCSMLQFDVYCVLCWYIVVAKTMDSLWSIDDIPMDVRVCDKPTESSAFIHSRGSGGLSSVLALKLADMVLIWVRFQTKIFKIRGIVNNWNCFLFFCSWCLEAWRRQRNQPKCPEITDWIIFIMATFPMPSYLFLYFNLLVLAAHELERSYQWSHSYYLYA